jgi:hypothetical protein
VDAVFVHLKYNRVIDDFSLQPLQYIIKSNPVTVRRLFTILLLFLAELGDYDPVRHSPGYVSEFRFLSSQSEELEERIHQTHAKLAGIQPSQAENRLKSYSHEIYCVLGELLNCGEKGAALYY